jgi:uncharacterized protein YgbK (DUF1537 family)
LIGLIADDLTGACDSAVPFLAGGRVEVGLWPHLPSGDLACASLSTETRSESPATAFDRSKRAAGFLRAVGVSVVYRKIDSQLRGNVSADLAGALHDHEGSCIVAPALPQAGRVTIGGRQRWNGHEVDLLSLLATTGRPVHSGAPETSEPGKITVCDAQSDEDLAVIARAVLADPGVLPAGTAGLASQLQRVLGIGGGRRGSWPKCKQPAAVIGSPAARAQADDAKAKGWPVVWLEATGPLPDLDRHDGLVMSGGETAARVLGALGATGIELLGEPIPLMVVGLVIGGRRAGMPVAVKSGAFGGVDAIDAGLRRLAAGD